ncbi:MAG: cytidyltransferase-related domain protein [Acidimicrobiales bacterium]|jgi:D-beta-D-heptose 7-phosphate kinase/D-beta-D-heptose 1-phosphate adenosyltransferase|nr:cytidyltransferase-related domain protein [Acidimicrobiales bacterium]
MSGPVVVVGDTFLDRDVQGVVDRVCPDAPVPVVEEMTARARPGGAGLAALIAAHRGAEVVLVTALADDDPGRELTQLLVTAGVDIVDAGLDGPTPEKIRVRSAGQSLLRLDRGCRPSSTGPIARRGVAAIRGAGAVLAADYGRGLLGRADVQAVLTTVAARRPLVWDPHPQGARPVPGARLATPNEPEAASLSGGAPGTGLRAVTRMAGALREGWGAHAVAITLGARGALLTEGHGAPLIVPAPSVAAGDCCGAGDCFAVTAAELLASGALPSEAVSAAVATAAAFVASGGTTAPASKARPVAGPPIGALAAEELAASVRRVGGTVVAAGGCFDLIHAGHVTLLQAARRLGDCLIVCLNSDDSVRALKGADRPVVPVADRVAVLLALGCVDAVAVFDETTPAAVIGRLQPHVFAKGGDYAGTQLPEADAVAEWGGQVVVVPYLEGRSSTHLLREVGRRAR